MTSNEPPDRIPPGQARQPTGETHGERARRGGRRIRLYAMAGAAVLLLAYLIALVAANTRSVHLSWVFGSGEASIVWVIFLAALAGWLLGLLTGATFRWRTRLRGRARPG